MATHAFAKQYNRKCVHLPVYGKKTYKTMDTQSYQTSVSMKVKHEVAVFCLGVSFTVQWFKKSACEQPFKTKNLFGGCNSLKF